MCDIIVTLPVTYCSLNRAPVFPLYTFRIMSTTAESFTWFISSWQTRTSKLPLSALHTADCIVYIYSIKQREDHTAHPQTNTHAWVHSHLAVQHGPFECVCAASWKFIQYSSSMQQGGPWKDRQLKALFQCGNFFPGLGYHLRT